MSRKSRKRTLSPEVILQGAEELLSSPDNLYGVSAVCETLQLAQGGICKTARLKGCGPHKDADGVMCLYGKDFLPLIRKTVARIKKKLVIKDQSLKIREISSVWEKDTQGRRGKNPIGEPDVPTLFLDAVLKATREKGESNLTALFLDTTLKATGGKRGSLWRLLRKTLRKYNPLLTSSDMVEDFIQGFFLKVIRRDAWRVGLLAGRVPTHSQIAWMAMRSMFSDLRDTGKEPVSRALYAAKTYMEQKRGTLALTEPSTYWGVPELMEVPDVRMSGVQERESFEEAWEWVEKIIRDRGLKNTDFHLRIFKDRLEGRPISETAKSEGVSVNRVRSRVQKAVSWMRKERESYPVTPQDARGKEYYSWRYAR